MGSKIKGFALTSKKIENLKKLKLFVEGDSWNKLLQRIIDFAKDKPAVDIKEVANGSSDLQQELDETKEKLEALEETINNSTGIENVFINHTAKELFVYWISNFRFI